MKSSDTIGKVMEKIDAVSQDMGVLGRSADNPFFKNKYVPLEKVQEQLQPKLEKNKVGVSQPLYEHGIATIVTDLESGEWVLFPAHINNTGLKPQDQMSGVTYLKRYGLVGVFNLELGDKDDDGNSANTAANLDDIMKRLGAVSTVEELNRTYLSLSPQMREDSEVQAKCKEIKAELTK